MRKITFRSDLLKSVFLLGTMLLTSVAMAQIKTNFSPRFSETVNGDVTIIANNVVSEHPTNNYNGNGDNNGIFSSFVDIDSDGSTFNSSSANLVNPSPSSTCITFTRAYLYWAAANKENGPDNNGNMTGNGNPEVSWPFDQVRLMLPGSNTYDTITADEVIYDGRAEHFVNDPYVCIKDITSEVQGLADPYGKFQVANVKATVGNLWEHIDFDDRNTGTSGGWQIVFVYESPQLSNRNITLFDGYANVTQTDNSFDILFDGFQTVPNGPVNANVVIGSIEGDRGIHGDQLQIFNTSGNWESISTSERAVDNFFNSKITVNESPFLNRNPASSNTLGFDASLFELSNNGRRLIDNDQTSATFRLTSNQETYGLYLMGLSVEVFEPSLGALSFTTNVIGSTFDPGDNAPVEIRVKNVGNDDIENLEINLILPPQVEFTSTDPLPPGVTFSFDNASRELRFFVEDGYTDINDPEYELDFNLFVNYECVTCSADIGLQAMATFTGATNPNMVSTLSSGTVDECGIGNHDPTYLRVIPVISFDDASAIEGSNIPFGIRSSHLLARDAIVNVGYANITASDSDYNAFTSYTIPTGTGNTTMNLSTIDDDFIELDETFDITLTSSSEITILDNTARGTIIDNDNVSGTGIEFANTNVIVTEGTDAFAVYTVTLTGNISENVTVDYTTIEGSALNPGDFITTNGTLTFTPTVNSLEILVPITDDNVIEITEDFSVELSNIQSNLGIGFVDGNSTNTANGTINDDDGGAGTGIEFANTNVIVTEGTDAFAVYTVTLTGNISENVTVDYTTIEGSALNPGDFITTNGTLSFTPTVNSLEILVPITDDDVIEPTEDFSVELSNIQSNLGIGFVDGNTTNTATGTILNDDNAAPGDGISFTNTTVSVLEGNTAADTTQLSFEVSYTGAIPAGETVSVDYTTVVGTADGTDFVEIATQTIQFTENNKTQIIVVDVIEDINIENDEDFTVVLSNITTTNGFVTGFVDGNTTNTATGTILNDDGNTGDGLSFANTNVIVTEGTDEFAVFIVTLTGNIAETVTVDYTTIIGTALNPDDFVTTTGTLNFTQTVSSLEILVPITDDNVIEPTEGFTVELSNIQSNIGIDFVNGNTINTANGTINDDDMGEITANDYIEEYTVMCGDEIPPVPNLTFSGGCGGYTVDFTETENFPSGTEDYMIIRTWNVSDICGNTATFEQIIFVMQQERVNITIEICIEDDPIDLLDSLPADFDTNGTFTVTNGNASINGSMFDPQGLELGEFTIEYASTSGDCKYYVDYTINVNNDCIDCNPDNLIVSKALTINGDGINDYFELTGLENCNFIYDMQIFNRWGKVVGEAKDYQNNWGGTSPDGSAGSAINLPTGTYFYIITLRDTEFKPVNGYLYIGSN